MQNVPLGCDIDITRCSTRQEHRVILKIGVILPWLTKFKNLQRHVDQGNHNPWLKSDFMTFGNVT